MRGSNLFAHVAFIHLIALLVATSLHSLLAVEPGNAELQNSRKDNPQKIRNIHKRNPSDAVPDMVKSPNQRRKHQQNIEACQPVVTQAELNRRVGSVENQIQDERQEYAERQASP